MYSLLLDIGGSFIKSCLYDHKAKVLINYHQTVMCSFIPSPSVNRREIYISNLENTVLEVVSNQLSYSQDIKGIFVSGQMGCWTLRGLPSLEGRLVSWQDNRYLDEYQDLDNFIESFDIGYLTELNGNEFNGGTPFVGMLTCYPEIAKSKKPLIFQSLISLVAEILTNSNPGSIHITDAAASGLVSMKSNIWASDIIEKYFENVAFPEVLGDVKPIGNFRNTSIAVFCGVGDQQASLLGVGIEPGNIVINIGTGGQVACLGESNVDAKVKIRPFFANKKVSTCTHLLSGRFLNKVIETSSLIHGESLTFEKLERHYSNTHQSFIALDSSEYLNDTFHRGLARNLGQADYIRECLSLMVRDYLNAINNLGGVDNKEIIFAGGVGQKSQFIIQGITKTLETTNYHVSQEIETTLAGLRNVAIDVLS